MGYLFIDVETGGLDPQKHSLLTLSCDLVTDIGDKPSKSFSMFLPHAVYNLDVGALQVNKIDIIKHHDNAAKLGTLDYQRAKFIEWLTAISFEHKVKAVGWNIKFDLDFIFAQLLPREIWNRYVDYHALDVCALVEFLILQDKLPDKRKLVDVAQYFGFDVARAHSASYDNYLCRNVLAKLLEL